MMVRALLALALACAPAALAGTMLRAFGPEAPELVARENAGRPYVLALWSIRCEPCIREMPLWRELQARHPHVRIVLVAADPPQDRDQVLAFLERHDPGGVQRWQFTGEADERIRYAIDPRWRGELPRAYFFDAAHRVTVTTGLVERAEAERWFARSPAR